MKLNVNTSSNIVFCIMESVPAADRMRPNRIKIISTLATAGGCQRYLDVRSRTAFRNSCRFFPMDINGILPFPDIMWAEGLNPVELRDYLDD